MNLVYQARSQFLQSYMITNYLYSIYYMMYILRLFMGTSTHFSKRDLRRYVSSTQHYNWRGVNTKCTYFSRCALHCWTAIWACFRQRHKARCCDPICILILLYAWWTQPDSVLLIVLLLFYYNYSGTSTSCRILPIFTTCQQCDHTQTTNKWSCAFTQFAVLTTDNERPWKTNPTAKIKT